MGGVGDESVCVWGGGGGHCMRLFSYGRLFYNDLVVSNESESTYT